MTDETRLADPVPVLARLPRGAAVILRHYGAGDRTPLAMKMAQACRRLGLFLVIAGNWRLAAATGAAGLHLPQHQTPAPGARLWRKRGRMLTMAAHGPRSLARARAMKADAALLSPINPTASHPDRKALGATRAALMIRSVRIPVVALGGVGPKTLRALKRRGFAGVAGIGFALGN